MGDLVCISIRLQTVPVLSGRVESDKYKAKDCPSVRRHTGCWRWSVDHTVHAALPKFHGSSFRVPCYGDASDFLSRLARAKEFVLHVKQEAFEKCWAHSPLRAAARPNFTLPFIRCRYCRTPPAHRCPRQRQRQQRVTKGSAGSTY